MLVKKWMSKNVISVQANDSVIKAQLLLKEHNIKRLPIMEKGMLVGIVTDRDLRIFINFRSNPRAIGYSAGIRRKSRMLHITAEWNLPYPLTFGISLGYMLEESGK
jgi:CBS-domain-containing membrane protein